jgi:hydrogenase nickel incorporation protein HypA/HybF
VHELAITEGVVDAVTERLPDARITCVHLEIGALSGVVADSVRFCCDFEPDSPIAICPCGSIEVKVIAGEELKISAVQVA